MHTPDPFEMNTPTHADRHAELSWEEGAVDSLSTVEGFVESPSLPPRNPARWVVSVFVTLLALLLVQVGWLQLARGKQFRLLAEGNRLRQRLLLAPRGNILDARGELLTQNTVSFQLIVTPVDVPAGTLAGQIKSVSLLLGLPPDDMVAVASKTDPRSFDPVILARDISKEQGILFETKASDFPGFAVETIPIRDYPDSLAFSHLLGFTGNISPEEMNQFPDAGYDPRDYIGKSGIEQTYEQYIRGTNGKAQVEVDASGKPVKVLGTIDPKPGNVLSLHIDRELQKKLYDDLSNKGARGAAVALDPRNGAVLALVSLPGFDSNKFAHGIKTEEYAALLNDKNLPLFNRAIAGTYPPGSTSKLMTATAGLSEKVVDQNTVIVDTGNLLIPNQFDPSQVYQFRGWKPGGLGPMTVRSAIAESSDIFFYEVAGGSPNGRITGLGAQKLAEYFRKFGLGKTLGIDVPGEKPGLVPDPAWKMRFFNNDPLQGKWYLGDTYHLGIGQGDLLTTPLQVAEWTAIVAQGGTGFVPEVADKVVDQAGTLVWQNKLQVLVSNVAPADIVKIVQEGMRQAVVAGTARSLAALPISSAGKTGTSQFDGSDPSRTHAWFTAYAPYEDPQIVITVLVEAGGEGHAAAVPVAKDALAWWAAHRYKK